MASPQRRALTAVVAALAALQLSAPSPSAAVASLALGGSHPDPTGPLVAAVALLAWPVAGWLAVTVTVVLLSRVPGLLGRTARALAARVAPATVRRALEAALGLTVAVGALGPATALAAPGTGPSAAVAPTAGAAWDLDWPSSAGAPPRERVGPPATTPASTGTTRPTPTLSSPPAALPSARPPSARPPSAAPPTVRPVAPAPTAVPPAVARTSAAVPAPALVVVRAGDSLWSLAESSLRRAGTTPPTDRQVAQAWPRWWAANRQAIGDDPDFLLPGTVLRPPVGSPGPG